MDPLTDARETVLTALADVLARPPQRGIAARHALHVRVPPGEWLPLPADLAPLVSEVVRLADEPAPARELWRDVSERLTEGVRTGTVATGDDAVREAATLLRVRAGDEAARVLLGIVLAARIRERGVVVSSEGLVGSVELAPTPDGGVKVNILDADPARHGDAAALLRLIAERPKGRPPGSRYIRDPSEITEAYRALQSEGDAHPSQERVAAQLHLDSSTFKRALQRARSRGYAYPPRG